MVTEQYHNIFFSIYKITMNIGFIINGIGGGHTTQALTIKSFLKEKNIKLCVVLFAQKTMSKSEKKEKQKLFPNCQIGITEMNATAATINNMNFQTGVTLFKSFISNRDYSNYEKQHNLNLWITFWTPTFRKFNIPSIDIASQHCVKNIQTILASILCSQTTIGISLLNNNKYTIPTLINNKKLKRRPMNKLCLAYSVSGSDFEETINEIAKKHPDWKIKYFRKNSEFNFTEKNIKLFSPSPKFKKFLRSAKCVLCTSGNELIQECVYNKIPVATMACSKQQYEQNSNERLYVNKLKFAEKLNKNISLDSLANKNMNQQSDEISLFVQKSKDKVLKLINQYQN